jgi:hypothetical protein
MTRIVRSGQKACQTKSEPARIQRHVAQTHRRLEAKQRKDGRRWNFNVDTELCGNTAVSAHHDRGGGDLKPTERTDLVVDELKIADLVHQQSLESRMEKRCRLDPRHKPGHLVAVDQQPSEQQAVHASGQLARGRCHHRTFTQERT